MITINVVPELTKDKVSGKMTWKQVFKYYFPNMLDDEIELLLWEYTCYPYEDILTLKQIYKIYTDRVELVKTIFV